MKNIMTIILITFFAVGVQNASAQNVKKVEEITIKTSTQCGQCKTRLEKAMAYEKGVVSSILDVKKAEFTVKYKPAKTSPEKIRVAISKIGYDADNVKAIKKAHDKLPKCCQIDGHEKYPMD